MSLLSHREKLTLFRRRLSETQTEQEREETLAKEEAEDGIVAFLLRRSGNSVS